MEVQNKHVLVVGLARSGLAVARALVRRGAVVTVSDNRPPAEFREVLPELLKDKVGLELGAQRAETFLKNEMIVISPGVPWDLPQLQAARERGIPVYPEVEAASWFLPGPVVGITGSNGKTTTTSLLGDMLKASGFPTFVGGNIGNPLSAAVDQAEAGTKFVAELSSFQLEGIHEFRPHVAVMLNLSPNHLDRHPNLEAYAEAKRQIFRNQGGQDFAVLNADDAWVAGLRSTVKSRPVLFSRTRELPQGVFAAGGKVYYRVGHLERVLFETRDVRLKGDFNLEDVLAASTAACLLGADFTAIRKAVREFKAVEHRLEFVQEIKGVDFYNNSKATSVDATLKSLGAFERGVHLILGGKDKGAPYTPLIPLIKERARDVLLIGAAAPIIAQQLSGSTELLLAGDLENAVYEAFARARPGDTILLAPACSSFDQFHDYEERGRVFKTLVHQLAADSAAGRTWRPKLMPLPGSRVVPVEKTPEERPTAPIRETTPKPIEPAAQGVVPEPVQGAPVEISPNPSPEKTAAEKRLAARKRAQELASVRGWSVPASPKEAIPESAPAGNIERLESASDSLSAQPPPAAKEEAQGEAIPEVSSRGRPSDSAIESSQEAAVEPPPASKPLMFERTKPEAVIDRSTRPGRVGAPSNENKRLAISARGEGGPSAPHHVELSYVYEVGAADLPGMESQLVPEEEPIIMVSAGREDALDDEVMPFESRPVARSGSGTSTPNPKSGAKSSGKGGRKSAKQPKLFGGSES